MCLVSCTVSSKLYETIIFPTAKPGGDQEIFVLHFWLKERLKAIQDEYNAKEQKIREKLSTENMDDVALGIKFVFMLLLPIAFLLRQND